MQMGDHCLRNLAEDIAYLKYLFSHATQSVAAIATDWITGVPR